MRRAVTVALDSSALTDANRSRRSGSVEVSPRAPQPDSLDALSMRCHNLEHTVQHQRILIEELDAHVAKLSDLFAKSQAEMAYAQQQLEYVVMSLEREHGIVADHTEQLRLFAGESRVRSHMDGSTHSTKSLLRVLGNWLYMPVVHFAKGIYTLLAPIITTAQSLSLFNSEVLHRLAEDHIGARWGKSRTGDLLVELQKGTLDPPSVSNRRMPSLQRMLYSPRLDALMYESNYRTDIGTLADVCGMFSLACFTVLVTGGLHYVVLLLLRWTSILVGHHEEKSFPVPPPYVVSDVPPHEESLSTIEHSLTHLAVIMDGNRRYGGKGRIAEPSNVTSRHEAIREICREVCYDGVKESIAASPSASRPPSERAWVTPRYEYFLSLIRATALDGHRKGGEKLIDFIKDCITARIPILTVYAFSTENWRRPPYEVDTLMTLFFFFFERIRHTAKEYGIYVRFVCTDVVRLPPRVLERMQAVERESRHFTPRRIVVNVCVSYGGQEEVACACSRVLQRRLRSGDSTSDVSAAELGAEMLRCLTQSDDEEGERRIFASTAAREPQLILRTSGEQRLSNFLLYQSAYSEFVFSKKRWPEMEAGDLLAAIRQFSSRDRRNGK